jgi:mono/diheme cytochrome c family protein
MSPFGSTFGGPLDDEEIDAIVAYIRAWEENPPVELPPEIKISQDTVSLDASQIYADLCAQCHGPNGEGGIGPSFQDPQLQATRSDEQLFDTINLGHEATAMIGWGDILSAEQIQKLVELIREFKSTEVKPTPKPSLPSFSADVMPILEAKCTVCHGTLGGWDATSYESIMNTGDNAPVVIPGNVDQSLLAQKSWERRLKELLCRQVGRCRLMRFRLSWIGSQEVHRRIKSGDFCLTFVIPKCVTFITHPRFIIGV